MYYIVYLFFKLKVINYFNHYNNYYGCIMYGSTNTFSYNFSNISYRYNNCIV